MSERKSLPLWRSLEDRTEPPPPAEAFVPRTGGTPALALADDVQPVKRRAFLQVMGTALAMGAGCTKQPEERIIPHVKPPEDAVAGRPLFYASATVLAGIGTGVLVEQNEGRPTKIEGNPEHPASLGGTDAFMQAATFDLYDPSRSKTLTHLGTITSFGTLVGVLQKETLKHRSKRGEGLRILTGAVTSPTLVSQIEKLLQEMPLAKWHWYEAVSRPQAREGAELLFGKDLEARYDLDDADVIVSLDADLFGGMEGRLAYTRQWATRRSPPDEAAKKPPPRLYAFEPTPSITGARADHRFPVRAADVELVARALAARVGADAAPADAPGVVPAKTLDAIAKDLKRAGKRALVVPGDFQPAAVHALAHAMNVALGSVGETVSFAEPVVAGARNPMAQLAALAEDMKAGKVELLLLLGVNPVYDAPADLAFEERLKNVPLRVHLGLYDDETAGQCHFHVPEAHPLEAWSDVRAYDGTVSLVQPLVAPLYGGKTAHDLLVALSNSPDRSGYDVVRAQHAGSGSKADAEAAFRRALHDGVVHRAAASPPAPPPAKSLRSLPSSAPSPGLEVVFRPDASTFDGRFANNAWLQELPRPLTKMTWDNAAHVSPDDAKRLSLETGDVIVLEVDGRSVRAPVWIMPGQAPGSVAVHLGYGRRRGGKISIGVGFDAQAIRTSTSPWHRGGLAIKKTGETHDFATTQGHHSMEGRDIVRSKNFGEKEPEHHKHLSLYPDREYKGYAWGMAIDLAACVGCNACVAACHAENNVPVVGKTEVLRSREMHWLRVDRYYEGPPENPKTHFQPLPCMQCEAAPCEVVCPVQATTHSDEGLNDMVYNRCVGTKYCSNNCPYKVRRYNFFGYSVDDVFGLDMKAPSVRLLHNPDVTVRSYGVMEKCTYCVQRINDARIESKKESRSIRDGEVMTACQSACPARAISFGNINDKGSEVAKRKAEERNYALLDELNTKPRTTYLSALWNPNPEIEG